MPPSLPDWQLPAGVDRPLWDYLHSPLVAAGYDAGMAGHPLFEADQRFVEKHCPQAGKLLDLGCGTGRLLIPFARRGYSVVGVDLSAEMLAIARRRASQENVTIQLIQGNLVQLGLAANSFDYAACLFSTLGMVVGEAERRRVVANVQRVLRPGGRFIVHAHNYWFNLHDPAGRKWLLADLLPGKRLREKGSRPMLAHQGVAGLALHHFRHGELVRLLTAAGFHIVEIQPLDPSARPLNPSGWLTNLWAWGYLVLGEKE